ncbi:MAG: IS110 family transposase [Gemmatimonadaceae bacterium]
MMIPTDTIGLDLHKRETQLCILTADGELIERRIATTRARFTEALGTRPRARILVEAATESEWVARHLESLGHEVIVADPSYAPMYATRSRRVKTDKRDARTLAQACRLGAYRAIHRVSDAQRHVRAELAVRDALVRTRTRYVALIKAVRPPRGVRLTQGDPESTTRKLEALAELPATTRDELTPLVALLAPINTAIAAADHRIAELVAADPVVMLLTTAPTIGPVTAAAFVATLDQVTRFQSADQVTAYLGLVPSEHSSGERQHRGRITKTGNTRMRWLLVEAGWRILRSTNLEVRALKAWGEAIAARRGKRVAVVALARKLAGILYAMWRDNTPYRAAAHRAADAAA